MGQPSNFTTGPGNMSLLRPLFFLLCIGTAAVADAQMQERSARPGLQEELCSCMSAIPANSDDARFEANVRTCLENGVLHHPGEVLDLLERHPQRGNKAYLLGLILGGALEGRCAGFQVVKARLQQMPARVPNDRKGT